MSELVTLTLCLQDKAACIMNLTLRTQCFYTTSDKHNITEAVKGAVVILLFDYGLTWTWRLMGEWISMRNIHNRTWTLTQNSHMAKFSTAFHVSGTELLFCVVLKLMLCLNLFTSEGQRGEESGAARRKPQTVIFRKVHKLESPKLHFNQGLHSHSSIESTLC